MKSKKQLSDLVVQMPAPAFSKHLEDDEKEEDRVAEFVHGEIEEKLIEEIGSQLDAYYALTGEPITASLTFAHHAYEAFEMATGAGLGHNAISGVKPRTVIITPSRSRSRFIEDEDENESELF